MISAASLEKRSDVASLKYIVKLAGPHGVTVTEARQKIKRGTFSVYIGPMYGYMYA